MTAKPADNRLRNIAVLIDADNASANTIGHILAEIEKLGSIRCKKIYGDWGSAHIKGWQEALLKYAIEPMQQFAYVKGKNATDIGMVIEAMDLLHSNDYDGFCLVSSDSDFTSLAIRIRKNNIKVFGFGKHNTVDSFTHACDRFFYVEDLRVAQTKKQIDKPKPKVNTKPEIKNGSNITNSQAWDGNRLKCDTKLLNTLREAISSSDRVDTEGWVNFAIVGSNIKSIYPTFDVSDYGYKKTSDLVKKIDLFETRFDDSTLFIRMKNQKTFRKKAVVQQETIPYPVFNEPNISINFSSNIDIDYIAFRLKENGRVRNDGDMIFYGQVSSPDKAISLIQEQVNGTYKTTFSCQLTNIVDMIEQIDFIAVSTGTNLSKAHPIGVTISHNKKQLFEGDFGTDITPSKTRRLLTLVKKGRAWHLHPQNKIINGNLAQICEQYGIEISDD